MSKEEKMVERLLAVPKDYTYAEAVTLAGRFGYEEYTKGTTSGSRVLLMRKRDRKKILLHKPHPEGVMKKYAVKQFLSTLIANGDIV